MGDQEHLSNIADELNNCLEVLKQLNHRELSNLQLNMILQQRYNSIINHHNNLVFNGIEDLTYYSKQVETFQFQLAQIINHRPRGNNGLIWFELESLRLMYVNLLINYWGEGGVLRLQGQAHVLVNILSGIELTDISRISVDKDHPEYIRRNALAFNLGNQQAGIYYLASTLVYRNARKYAMEWTTTAVKGNQMVLSVLDQIWDPAEEIELLRRIKSPTHPRRFIPYIQIFQYMTRYLILVHIRLDANFPASITNVPFLDVGTTASFLRSLQHLTLRAIEFRSDLTELIEKGSFDEKNQLDDSFSILEEFQRVDLCNLLVEGLILVEHIWEGSRKEPDVSQLKNVLTMLIVNLQSEFAKIRKGLFMEDIRNEFYIFYLEYVVYLAFTHDYFVDDSNYLEDIYSRLSYLQDQKGRKRFPNLILLMNIAKLTILLHRKGSTGLTQLALEFEQLISAFEYQPRDAIAADIIFQILQVIFRNQSLSDASKHILERIEKHQSALSPSYLQDLLLYCSYLDNTGERMMAEIELFRLESFNVLDPFSVMVPDFSGITANTELENVVYIPFNLGRDYLDQ